MLKLRLLTGPRAGRQLRVSDIKPVSIGRRRGRLRLHDSRVSKDHAEITFDNDLWQLTDLGSANGTYVNQLKINGPAELEPGDLIQIGRVLIKVVRCDEIGMDTRPTSAGDLSDGEFDLGDIPGEEPLIIEVDEPAADAAGQAQAFDDLDTTSEPLDDEAFFFIEPQDADLIEAHEPATGDDLGLEEETPTPEDADEHTPALVGLHLDQAPPQQPQATHVTETDDLDNDEATHPDFASPTDEEPETEQPSLTPADNAAEAAGDTTLTEAEEDAGFDIAAAFDALSEGLDDSLEHPAVDDTLEPSPEETENSSTEVSPEPDTAEPASDDPLIGSQLDVSFIKDALSKLDEDPSADQGEQPSQSPEDAQPDTAASHSPPPGLNPSSLTPPQEPYSDAPLKQEGGKGKWLLGLVLFLGIAGTSGLLIQQNLLQGITGREQARSDSPASTPLTTPEASTALQTPEPIVNLPEPAAPEAPAAENLAPSTTPPPPTPIAITPDSTTDASQESTPFETKPELPGTDTFQGLPANDSETPLTPLIPPTPPTQPQPLPQQPAIQAPEATPAPAPMPLEPDIAKLPAPEPEPQVEPIPTPATPPSPARIVFLVDASGSMVDSLPQMLRWLGRALKTIEPDERFAIYFFKSGEPIAIQPEGMLAPSFNLLEQLREDWLNPEAAPVFPSGRSDPTKALQQALTLNPTDIYLLSDNAFALHKGDTTPDQAIELVQQALDGHPARLHGVQFFYRDDNNVLQALANQTEGGTFEFVREDVIPDTGGIDLLKELEQE